MWKYYFPKSEIYAIDLYDKSRIEEHAKMTLNFFGT